MVRIGPMAAYATYAALGWPTSATWGNASSTSWGFQDNGDMTALSQVVGTSTTGWALSHNGAHQITGESLTNNSLEMKASTTGLTYAVNSLNQYTTVNSTAQTYDKNGNLTGDGTWTYEYDEENRLRNAAGPHTALYDYDPLGRRRSKTVDTATTTYYTSDGAEEVAEWTGTGALSTRYLNGISTDNHVAMLAYNTTTGALTHRYYYHPDWHGSTMLLSDETNVFTNATPFKYGAYGESQDASTGNPFRYTGRRLDAETGLYYYRARYYSPTIGRFLQTDPIGSKDDLDLYAYVKNDPVNSTDPTGTERDDKSYKWGADNANGSYKAKEAANTKKEVRLGSRIPVESKSAEIVDSAYTAAGTVGAVQGMAELGGYATRAMELGAKVTKAAEHVESAAHALGKKILPVQAATTLLNYSAENQTGAKTFVDFGAMIFGFVPYVGLLGSLAYGGLDLACPTCIQGAIDSMAPVDNGVHGYRDIPWGPEPDF